MTGRRILRSGEIEPLLGQISHARPRLIALAILTSLAFALPGCLISGSALSKREQESLTLEHGKLMLRLEKAGVKSRRVLEAVRAVPRHEFVPGRYAGLGYLDRSIPITAGVDLPAPLLLARMLEYLDPRSDDKALQISAGTGYQAALLSKLVRQVYSIELLPSAGRSSMHTISRLGYGNINIKCGDPLAGWEEHAPYDRILLTFPVREIPQALMNQLRENGRMVFCRGDRLREEAIVVVSKKDGEIVEDDSLRQHKEAPTNTDGEGGGP